MPKTIVIALTAQERTALENAARYGPTPSFRLRCQAILLKTQKRPSADVASQLGCCEVALNTWLKRYQQDGLAGLNVKTGRGRKPILQTQTDLAAVRRAVQGSRQRLSLAKAELEQDLGKEFSQLTLRRFLKKTVDATNVLEGR